MASCSNALEALKVLEKEQIDLIFLDIQMPGLTGLQFIQTMRQKPQVILITAYEKFALEGFNLDVTDYLVKPVPLDRFIKACNKAYELHALRTSPKTPGVEPEYIFVPADYSLLKVVLSDIKWIEGLKDYIRIHLASSSKAIITRMPMKQVEEMLPKSKFIRIHKSYIISLSHVTAIRKTSVFMGEMELPVSDSYPEAMAAITGKG